MEWPPLQGLVVTAQIAKWALAELEKRDAMALDLIEVRCTCSRNGKHPLLAKVAGSDFDLEVKCRFCRRTVRMRYPDPLSYRKKDVATEPKNSNKTPTKEELPIPLTR